MSADEQMPTAADNDDIIAADAAAVERERSEKILKAKVLYSHGSRNYLVKSYAEAADELSEVCALYEELYGELSDELGMPYLLYAKSLIALALDENKVIDVPDEEADDDDDDDDDDDGDGDEAAAAGKEDAINGEVSAAEKSNGAGSSSNGNKNLETTTEALKIDEADSTADGSKQVDAKKTEASVDKKSAQEPHSAEKSVKDTAAEAVSSSDDNAAQTKEHSTNNTKAKEAPKINGNVAAGAASTSSAAVPVLDGEKPSTSNGDVAIDNDEVAGEDEEENEAASSLQLAWEILELAAKIFKRQGLNGLSNLAEVQTELANIEFENNILDAARDDYEKALRIYRELPNNYRRAMAEIHYKIGLTFLMQQANKEGAESLKSACNLIEGEIEEIKEKKELTEKDKNNIQDMEETKQEIWAKIAEIEETQAQQIAEVRAALDSYIHPDGNEAGAGTSASAAAASSSSSAGASSSISSTSKPTDITHLIKRKKPEEPTSEAEAKPSPAKRQAS